LSETQLKLESLENDNNDLRKKIKSLEEKVRYPCPMELANFLPD